MLHTMNIETIKLAPKSERSDRDELRFVYRDVIITAKRSISSGWNMRLEIRATLGDKSARVYMSDATKRDRDAWNQIENHLFALRTEENENDTRELFNLIRD